MLQRTRTGETAYQVASGGGCDSTESEQRGPRRGGGVIKGDETKAMRLLRLASTASSCCPDCHNPCHTLRRAVWRGRSTALLNDNTGVGRTCSTRHHGRCAAFLVQAKAAVDWAGSAASPLNTPLYEAATAGNAVCCGSMWWPIVHGFEWYR